MRHLRLLSLCTLITATSSALSNENQHVTSLLEMRQDKVVMQQWDLSCGAAALTTLLKYQHGIDTDEKTVTKGLINRKEYIQNPDLLKIRQGFSLRDLKRYTQQVGLIGKGYGKLKLNDLQKMAPILVPVNLSGYNHFVIYRGRQDNRVLLADPAWGNRTLLVDAFIKAWINFPSLGHTGFTVASQGKSSFQNQLTPSPTDFVSIH